MFLISSNWAVDRLAEWRDGCCVLGWESRCQCVFCGQLQVGIKCRRTLILSDSDRIIENLLALYTGDSCEHEPVLLILYLNRLFQLRCRMCLSDYLTLSCAFGRHR
jgi:hypothetical protein